MMMLAAHCSFVRASVGIAAWLIFLALARAQAPPDDGPMPAPPLATAVERALDAPYLTDAERRDLRIFHGLWRDDDLANVADRARAALIAGAYDDPSLMSEQADPLDRAEALTMLGRTHEAIALLTGHASPRAVRLTGMALEEAGHYADAAVALKPLLDALATTPTASASMLVEGVRAMLINARVAGDAHTGVARAAMTLLARARDELDRTYWPAHVMEAILLHDKFNRQHAGEAAVEALSLNPRSARAWMLLGVMAVESFDFDRAEGIAARLDSVWADQRAGAHDSSILGDLLRARMALRRRDADGAAAFVQRVLERAPVQPDALELQAAVAAAQFDFARVDELIAAADARAPDSPGTLMAVGRVCSTMRQYARAIAYLSRACERAPHLADAYIELGLVAMQAGKDELSLDALTTANDIERFNDRAANSLMLIQELLTYATLETEHFIVRYKPGIDEALARDMVVILEDIHDRVTGADDGGIDYEPSVKTQIELMPDHRWFAVRIAGMPELHTMAAATGPVLALEAPRIGPGHMVGPYDWPRVVRHEYTHTVTLARTHNRIPHWFTEAAAVYLEDAPRDYDRTVMLAQALARGDLFRLTDINLGFIRPKEPGDRALAYAQAHWMYEFLIERFGADAPLRLMDAYAQGRTQAEALMSVVGITPEAFMAEFTAWAHEQAIQWGLAPPDGAPTLAMIRMMDMLPARPASWLSRAFAMSAWLALQSGAVPMPTSDAIARWLEAYPDHPGVLALAVDAALTADGENLTNETIALLQRYATARPVAPLPHRVLAECFLAGEHKERAIPHLAWLNAREQHSPAYALELVTRYAALDKWDSAHAYAERVTQMAPYRADYRELAAAVAIKAGDPTAARRHLVALTILEPDRDLHTRRLEAFNQLMQQDANPHDPHDPENPAPEPP